MKKPYTAPVFYAEPYTFSESIAQCDIHVGESESPDPILINEGDSLCPVGDSGHYAGKKGSIPREEYPLTLFNDGDADACEFDWGGGNVTSHDVDYATFGEAFYGPVAGNDNHRPSYFQKTFFS